MEWKRKSGRLVRSVSVSPIFISEDLLAEILKRLPGKTLCRFLSVSKPWKTLISSTAFAQTHSNPNNKLCISLDKDYSHAFVDTIHGVVCFSYTLSSSYDSTYLLNASIYKYVLVPEPHNLQTVNYTSLIGFGYSSCYNDFKLVRVWISGSSVTSTYEVYSSRSGTWKEAKSNALEPNFKVDPVQTCTKGSFVNGTIHWILHTSNEFKYFLLMFDCEREEFTTSEIPRGVFSFVPSAAFGRRTTKLMRYGGTLCLVMARNWGYIVEMWAMVEKNGKWKKVYRLETTSFSVYYHLLPKLASLGPNKWLDWAKSSTVYDVMLNNREYEETIDFMDYVKAKNYFGANKRVGCYYPEF